MTLVEGSDLNGKRRQLMIMSRMRRHRLILLTEPYIQASYTVHVHSYLT